MTKDNFFLVFYVGFHSYFLLSFFLNHEFILFSCLKPTHLAIPAFLLSFLPSLSPLLPPSPFLSFSLPPPPPSSFLPFFPSLSFFFLSPSFLPPFPPSLLPSFLPLNSTSLIYLPIFILVSYCLYYCSYVVRFESGKCESSHFAFLFLKLF